MKDLPVKPGTGRPIEVSRKFLLQHCLTVYSRKYIVTFEIQDRGAGAIQHTTYTTSFPIRLVCLSSLYQGVSYNTLQFASSRIHIRTYALCLYFLFTVCMHVHAYHIIRVRRSR